MRKIWKRGCSVLLAIVLLVGVVTVGELNYNVFAVESTGVAVMDNFINDARFTNGAAWGDVRPKLSPFDGWSCAAYCADFAYYCFGNQSPKDGTYFTGATNIRAGDVLVVGNGSNGYGHWFVCLKRSGNNLYVAEGNYTGGGSGKVRIGWNYKIANDSTISGAEYSFTNGWHFLSSESSTITLDSCGGSCNITSTIRNYGAYWNLPTPTRSGYKFDGWYTKKDGAGYKYTNNTRYWGKGESITLYANWINVNPGKSIITNSSNEYYLGSITFTWTLTENTTHYNIVFYKENSSGEYKYVYRENKVSSGVSIAFNGPSSIGNYRVQIQSYNSNEWNSDHTDYLYTASDYYYFSVFDKIFNLYYNTNGGTNSPANQTGNGNITLSNNMPTRSGYTFLGWATSASAATAQYQPGSQFELTHNTTLYAVWAPITLSGISIKTLPNKNTYTVGESFDQSGLTLTAKYSDNSTQTINSGFTCSGYSSTTAGTKTINVTYQGKTATFTITVNAKPVTVEPVVAIHNYTANKTVDYKTTVTFSADVTNPVSGAKIHWFIDGQDKGASDTYTVKSAKESFTVQAKYIKDGKVLAESGVEKVSVKTGFFAKLLAFFRSIFGGLPKVVQGYMGAEIIEKII